MNAPPPDVVGAFGATDPLEPLAGGTGRSWRAGGVVLKPLDRAPHELPWQAATLDSLRPKGFRVAPPVAAADGAFVVDGWTAWRFEPGRHEARRWVDIAAAGRLFHRAILGVPRPDALIDPRTDAWRTGDRVAFGEQRAGPFLHVRHLRRLRDLWRPIGGPSQLVHGDLTGNVLFAEGLPPAVIDFAPYWRPAAFASAVVVGDALLWEGAEESLVSEVADAERFGQYLVRALIYRLVTHAVASPDEPDYPDEPVRRAVDIAAAYAFDRF